MIKGTLNQGNKILLFLIGLSFSFCNNVDDKTNSLLSKSISQIGKASYYNTYNNACDSIQTWALNNLGHYKYIGRSKNYILDSLLCFNSAGDRVITCILTSHKDINAPSDGIDFFYGEKIQNCWYFFAGEYIVVPRSMIKDRNSSPLTFGELHKVAMKEVFSGYLTSAGNINEGWFKQHFENVGMCADCKTREDFQRNIVLGAAAQWANRDTTQPIKRLPHTQLP